MRSWLIAAVVLLLALGASAQDFPPPPGQIAYIGVDGNVYVFRPADNQRVPLTTDAVFSSDTVRVYEWPTWSNDGRLAYFGTTVTEGTFALAAHISADGRQPGTVAYTVPDTAFTYAAWSPRNCDAAADCRDLALLLSPPNAGGFAVRLLRDGVETADSAPITEIGTGAPFYFGWSPDGARMVWQRNNARVDLYDVAGGAVIDTLTTQAGAFFVPAWSPVDDRVLYGGAGQAGRTTDLTIAASGLPDAAASVLAAALPDPITFGWSPDGNAIAYADGSGTLTVVDAVTGEPLARTVPGVLAYFWSPDSRSLALVVQAQPSTGFSAKPVHLHAIQANARLQWAVLEIPVDDLRLYSTFVPTEAMAYLLTYFDQFALSHRIWSPDSRQIVYSEQIAPTEAVINVLDVTNRITVPLMIAEGSIGIWSYE